MVTRPRTSREELFKEIDKHLCKELNWKNIEVDVAKMCVEFPIAGENYAKQAVTCMKQIKTFLKENGITPENLKFIDDRIVMFAKIKTLRKDIVLNDRLTPMEIERFAQGIPFKTRGIVALDYLYNQEELEHLSNGISRINKVLQFYISNNETWPVKLIGEIKETAVSLTIARHLQDAKKEKTGQISHTRVVFFGTKRPKRKAEVVIDELAADFYVYQSIVGHTEMVVLSQERLELGDYIMSGVLLW